MRLPIEWLREFVAVKLSAQQLAERLTMAGLEIGAVEETSNGEVFDIEITPNRPDWLSVRGIAREVAAVTGQRLKAPQPSPPKQAAIPKSVAGRLAIQLDDKAACPLYIGRLIENVAVKPSPGWMQKRLIACGARPINNIVDITNYVLFELGQPLHAFDAALLTGPSIIVRRALVNEPITTLDGISRKLSPDILVISDAKAPIAIAGIMGSVFSGVTEKTKSIVLESALFDAVTIRRAGRKLGLTSESAYRFERGVDPEGVSVASQRAAQLIQELAGARAAVVKVAGSSPKSRVAISVEPLKAQRWLGMAVSSASLRRTLTRLGCRVSGPKAKGAMQVTPPSYRPDIKGEVDLYEEVARMVGYDRIKATTPTVSLTNTASAQNSFSLVSDFRKHCAGLGLNEVLTWSLIAESEALRCGYGSNACVRLVNPLSQDHALLRPSLLPGMLQAIRRNLGQGALGVRAFEVGNVFIAGVPANEAEQQVMGVIVTGLWQRDWKGSDPANFFRLKGLLEAVASGKKLVFSKAQQVWASANESTEVRLSGRVVGGAGAVSPKITQALDIDQPVWFAEIRVSGLLSQESQAGVKVSAPSLFPPVKRDLSVLLNRETGFEALQQVITETAGAWAVRAELIDRYVGKQVPENKYSATFSIEYRDPSRTLTADEVDAVHQRITQALIDRFSAVRR